MQSRIEQHADFESDIRDNPIKLLETIQVLMHDTIRGRYPYASVTDAMKNLLYIKQQDNEPLLDYAKRFKQARDVLKSHVGTKILDEFVETTREYKEDDDDDERTKLKEEAFGRWSAYMLVKNSDQNKFGSLLNGMTTQYAMGNNQFPKNVQKAIDIMSNHRFDNQKEIKKKYQDQKKKDEDGKVKKESSFAQAKKDMTCYCCGKKGHIVPDCPEKDTRKREDWAVKKGAVHTQDKTEKSDESEKTKEVNEKKVGWSAFQISLMNEEDEDKKTNNRRLKNSIILDNGSTLSIFANSDMVNNIRKSDTILQLATNAGTRESNQIADVPDYGTVWYDARAIANIFGLSDLKKKYRVTYDSQNGDCFDVHMKGKIIKFKCNKDGLYEYNVSDDYLTGVADEKKKEISHVIETVKENRSGFSDRQYIRAKAARELYHNVGSPTVDNFKSLLKMNVIKNCPVTIDDVNNAEKIFGPALSTLKGKSTRRSPRPVIRDEIELPDEIKNMNHDLDLCMDIMFVNELPMLTTIDKTIRFRGLVPLESRTHEECYRALDKVLRFYNQAGYRIRTIFCDGEFRAMMDKVCDDLDVRMNYTNALDHVPEAERNNRTIKERIRAAFHRLPFKKITKTMLRYLAMIQVNQLNLFPAKGGVSKYYSPRMILTQESLDYNKHCKIPFGSYVQANHETNSTSSNVARTIDCIYLRPNNIIQGGHELMDLTTGRVITRATVKVIPLTDIIIRTVERMAEDQGFKELKFKNRYGHIYADVDQIAGVNEDDEDEEDAQDDDDYEEDDEEYDEDEENDMYDDEIDPEEIDDIANDDGRQQGAQEEAQDQEIEKNQEGQEQEQQEDEDERENDLEEATGEDEHSNVSELRRSTRNREQVQRLEPKMTGQSYINKVEPDSCLKKRDKKVQFLQDRLITLEQCHNIVHQVKPSEDEVFYYQEEEAMIICRLIDDLNHQVATRGKSFVQQFILQQGLKKFGKRGGDAAVKEAEQLYKRTCFEPVSIKEMTAKERKKAQEALMFLCEKRDGTIKGRLVYNGKPTRGWLSREDCMSPTAALESIVLTSVIDAHERRDVMSTDIPNAFIQTKMPEIPKGKERVMMKITGALVDLLVDLNPELYGSKIVFENGRKVVYVVVLRAIYGMLEAAILWYKKFRKDLEEEGFSFNPYDPCVANKEVNSSQQTVVFHVDDLKSSHVDSKVNDDFEVWLNKKYGEHGKVATKRGKIHEYLGMTLDYNEEGVIKIDMRKYVKDMLESFPIKLESNQVASTPGGDRVFDQGPGKPLEKARHEVFHTFVAKGLFLAKRARPDIQQVIAILCTRVKTPNESDWQKLLRLMKYLNGTREKILRIRADDIHVVKWFVDAAFAVHPDFKSHTGAIMTMGDGAIQSISRKQKLNTRSSTESELVGVDDVSVMILWTKLFLEAQGYDIRQNVVFQDNKSAILLEVNGKKSAGKRSRALNIRYFFVTDQIEKRNLEVKYCPTNDMIGDYFTKPLQGRKFTNFRKSILGEVDNGDQGDQGKVGK